MERARARSLEGLFKMDANSGPATQPMRNWLHPAVRRADRALRRARCNLSTEEIEAVLAHELGHFKRAHRGPVRVLLTDLISF